LKVGGKQVGRDELKCSCLLCESRVPETWGIG
jgi:hypothetical protein